MHDSKKNQAKGMPPCVIIWLFFQKLGLPLLRDNSLNQWVPWDSQPFVQLTEAKKILTLIKTQNKYENSYLYTVG